MQRPRTPPGGGITGAMASIKLGSTIAAFISRTGLPSQRAIAVARLASIASTLREVAP